MYRRWARGWGHKFFVAEIGGLQFYRRRLFVNLGPLPKKMPVPWAIKFWKYDPSCLYQILHCIRGHRYTGRLILRPISAARPRMDLCTKTPPGGHSHMSVEIKCLSLDPLFYADPTPNDPLFLFSPHPMTPFFPLLYQILPKKIANFCALRANFEKFNDFVAILIEILQILP